MSPGGKPIVVLPSTTRTGKSRIVAMLEDGSGVVTTRPHVHYIVTEFAIAEMYAKTYPHRPRNLINIAHPIHREELERAAYARFGPV
eukprot:EC688807.1.p2 GENE.EC688807.1~~EC688807.1.p2  ORF type:complete len:87 (-),score=7.72 EC688807.1:166-426(-)